MNNIKYNKLLLGLFLGVVVSFVGCKEAQVETFDQKPVLYFPITDGLFNGLKGMDSMYVSFSHYPESDQITCAFKISLIGNILTSDTEYSVEVVDSLTTAKADEYTIPDVLMFKKGVSKDEFKVTINRKERLKTTDTKVVIKLKENKNFGLGFYNQLTVKLRFDDFKVQPLWWKGEIIDVYFGKYSGAKYDVFYAVSKRITIEGLEPWQIREIGLNMEKYILENGTLDEDGKLMELPIY